MSLTGDQEDPATRRLTWWCRMLGFRNRLPPGAVARDLGISRETLRTRDATTPSSRRPRVVTDAAAVLTP